MKIHGVIPTLVYGTAWKEERTAVLVRAALDAGFRGIDTANQRRHYHEAGVGAGLQDAIRAGVVAREDVFLQTKFTYASGQDARMPYDPHAPIPEQVARSSASSLEHLGVDRVDAYLLHGPWSRAGLAKEDREAWRAMEAVHDRGHARLLGISNVAIDQLEALYAHAGVKPTVVQNRTFTRPAADRAVRAFCHEHGIAYEGFSLLTAVPHVVMHPTIAAIAARCGRTRAEVVLRYCLARGMIVLTGTTSKEHMEQDLSIPEFALTADDLAAIDPLVER